ncbi:hypothetical protein E3N88_15955 [Mikania micrantha]|uniref:Uncharacterized protein n=1 Tax=Mikania micrantha TaxID=192012 RepID=A0A5N6P048_9ASTR|nr:hypothetical protein E3N88_15955 [Mikania micrantha]
MANPGEHYIYQIFPYAGPQVPATPPPPSPLPPPPASPIVPSPPHSPLVHASAERRQSSSPQRVPVWDGLQWMRGQARKTIGLPSRHQMAPRDEPQVVHEVGESSHQAERRTQMQQVSQDLQALRQDLHQHHTTLEDTRTTVLEILTSHLTLMEQVNAMGIDTQAWRTTVEEHLRRTWRQALVAAFWQQVAVWRERLQGWIWMLGMMSIEARLLCLAIVLATIAIVLACLPYFLR